MTPVSAFFVRIALVHLMVGTTLGALLLATGGMGSWTWLMYFRSAHHELLLFGWMVQLAFGVAAWILPRTSTRKGNRVLVAAFVLLNAGTLVAALDSALFVTELLLFARVLQIVAIASFAWYIWPRVRAFVDR